MTKTIEQKCVAALTAEPPPTLDQLLTLIAETEAGITEADTAAEVARAKFLDPIETPDINKARAVVEATEFTGDRLRSLLPRLKDKHREVEAAEDVREWRIDFAALAEERNALAKELRETYPAAVAALVSLFARIGANDAALSQLHGSRPSGAKGTLLGAELTARQLEAFTRDEPSLTRELRLPSWLVSSKLDWPPRELPASVMIAAAMPTSDPRRHSADWFAALREETEHRKAQEQKSIEQEAERSAEAKRAYEASLPR